MYNGLKIILRSILPKKILFRYEPFFRYILYQFYRGNDFQCNICGKKIKKFLREKGDRICPSCGSLARTRRLWQILQADYLKKGINVLDFSPSRSICRKLKKDRSITYKSSDLSGDFLADYAYDITNIKSEENNYDLIICYHILEHIENDIQAMRELYRVLKKGGVCLIQTPFRQGNIYEDPAVTTAADRLKCFGQEDHVRIYSADGLSERLKSCGFKVNINVYNENTNSAYGFPGKETVIVCKK